MLHRRCYMVVVIVIKFRFVIQGKEIKKKLELHHRPAVRHGRP